MLSAPELPQLRCFALASVAFLKSISSLLPFLISKGENKSFYVHEF